jgi:hypothetical protein
LIFPCPRSITNSLEIFNRVALEKQKGSKPSGFIYEILKQMVATVDRVKVGLNDPSESLNNVHTIC